MAEIVKNPKCSRCKSYWKPGEDDIKSSGEPYKSCRRCRERRRKTRKRCPHGRYPFQCRDCGGTAFCEHDRQRAGCRDCGGTSICEHDRLRHHCRECSGSSICEHDRRRNRCRECGGSQMCKHGRQKGFCKECDVKLWLVSVQATRIAGILKKSELERWKTNIEFIGCSPKEFKEHIESKMTAEMTWDNIHIDHAKPVSAFDLDNPAEFLQCVHYTNLQPLLALDNIRKGSKWSDADEQHWRDSVIDKSLL